MPIIDFDQRHCRGCGLASEDSHWGRDGETPDFTICPCCGVEHGYEDCLPDAARRFRERWRAAGMRWHRPGQRPDSWDAETQLRSIPPRWR